MTFETMITLYNLLSASHLYILGFACGIRQTANRQNGSNADRRGCTDAAAPGITPVPTD